MGAIMKWNEETVNIIYDCDEIFEILWGEDFYDDEYEYEYEDEDVGE